MSKAREAWLAKRKSGIGASEAAAVLGAHPFSTALEVWGRKRGIVDGPAESDAMEAGNRLEAVVARWFADLTGCKLSNPGKWRLYRHPREPHVFATPDRFIEHDPELPGERGLLEVKTTSAYRRDEWKEDVPVEHRVQVQHQLETVRELAITETGAIARTKREAKSCKPITFGRVCVLIGGQMPLFSPPMRLDERFAELMLEAERAFWRCVETGEEPAIDPLRDAKLLAQLWPDSDPEKVIELPAQLGQIDEELVVLKDERKALDAEITKRESAIKVALEDAEVGVLPSGASYSWKTQERGEYVVKASKRRVLRRRKAK